MLQYLVYMVKCYPFIRIAFSFILWMSMLSLTFLPTLSAQEYQSPLSLSITFDQWPEESSWDIRIGDTTLVHIVDYQSFGDEHDETTITVNDINLVPAQGYYFNFYDVFIDGICCIQGSGSFTLKDANGKVIITGGEFEVKESVVFNIAGDLCGNGLKDNGEEGIDCGVSCMPCIIGCMITNAHNYNSAALSDDGSCQTCDDGIKNGDELATDCGGVLCEPCIEGCLDETAHNYNDKVVISSGNCETCSDGIKNGDEGGIDCGGLKCVPCISNCTEDNYNTTSEIKNDMTVSVNQSIQSSHKVHANLNVEFIAGLEIVLGAGFEVGSGTVFKADIGGCE